MPIADIYIGRRGRRGYFEDDNATINHQPECTERPPDEDQEGATPAEEEGEG